jgi:hypothetical protein
MKQGAAPIRPWHWPLWMGTLGVALIVFYGILTPVWMLIRLVAWVTERPVFNPGRRPNGGGFTAQ